MESSPEQLAARVQAIVFDVDGVMTRGDLIYGPEGELKIFDVQDGHGFHLAREAGLKLALLSGRSGAALRRRADDLNVDALLDGVVQKGEALRDLMGRLRVKASEVCYVGDDLVDLPAMREAGFPVAVANAVAEVKERAAWVTERRGGDGAVREVIEFVLKARGLWPLVVRRYTEGEG